ncbi:MAG: methyl-accepting chemotaxis protein [Pseudomonadota bacterium]
MRNFNIGIRLGAGFAVVLLLLVAMTVVGLTRLSQASDMTTMLVNINVKHERLIAEWLKVVEVNAARSTAAWKVADPGEQKLFEQQMVKSSGRATEIQDLLGTLLTEPALLVQYKDVLATRKAYVAARKAVFAAKAAGDLALGKTLFDNDMAVTRDAYLASINQLSQLQRQSLDRAAAQAHSGNQGGRVQLIVLGGVAMALGIGLAYWISKSITIPINRAVRVAETVSKGDLTSAIEVRGTDETGKLMTALKLMNDSLVDIVGQVRGGTDTMHTASGEIATGNLDLSSRTEQQASSLQETAASMEELTSTVRLNAENARQASQMADQASHIASRGGAVVSQVVATMGAINDCSRKIVDIIGVIDAIAFQTNILALNAAVEAARAGEQGRGFAVVASEVRNLAQRSAAAAKEVKALIDDSVRQVASGSSLVDQAGRTMDEIVDSIGRVAGVMSQITDASDEQRLGIEQVNLAVGQMDQVTQQNAALVEQAGAAAESLQSQSAKLADLVSVFKLAAGEVARTTAGAPRAPLQTARIIETEKVLAPSGRGGYNAAARRPNRASPHLASESMMNSRAVTVAV